MRDIRVKGFVRLDGTKNAEDEGIICNFKGSEVVKKMALDLGADATTVPYKEALTVEVVISPAQMTIDDIAENGGDF